MNLERAFALIRQLQGALGGKSIRTGASTATWTASAFSAAVVIPHGLGTTPTYADASSRNALNGFAVTAVDATNITVTGFRTDNTAITGSAPFYWIAVG